ncbi:MAG: DUF308 domain-containing protein [Bacteroidota bacterium]|nr:DUF308 domain-containing protein [Bacteroidota bacterium]
MKRFIWVLITGMITLSLSGQEEMTITKSKRNDISSALTQNKEAKISDTDYSIPIIQSASSVEQTEQGTRPPAEMVASFDGLGYGFEGPQGMSRHRNPSDNSLAVGPDHIMQTVNSKMAIFTKKGEKYDSTGVVLYGPVNTNNVFRGFGGPCEEIVILGIMQISSYMRLREMMPARPLTLITGIISVLVGGILLFNPFEGAVLATIIIAVYAVLYGITRLYMSWVLLTRKREEPGEEL